MRQFIIATILCIFSSVPSFADSMRARIVAYEVIASCAAQTVGLPDRLRVDINRPTGHFFGRIPTMYNRCAVKRLNSAGVKAKKLSLVDYSGLAFKKLAFFINEIAVRSLK